MYCALQCALQCVARSNAAYNMRYNMRFIEKSTDQNSTGDSNHWNNSLLDPGLLWTKETKSESRVFVFGFRQDFAVFNWAQFEDEKRNLKVNWDSEKSTVKKIIRSRDQKSIGGQHYHLPVWRKQFFYDPSWLSSRWFENSEISFGNIFLSKRNFQVSPSFCVAHNAPQLCRNRS